VGPLLYFGASCKSLTCPHPGFDVFTKEKFTASGFLTFYLNVFIFAGECTSCGVPSLGCRLTCLSLALYIFFKVYLKSKVISPSDIDFETEFASIRHWKVEQETLETRKSGIGASLRKLIHTV
jgi:amino acid transporter